MSDNSKPASNRRVSTEQIASLVAVGLSIAALTVSLFEVFAIRQEQRAGVWPYLEIGPSYNGEGFALTLTNKGVGPALIGSTTLTYQTETVTDLDALIREIAAEGEAFSYDVYRSSVPVGQVVAPGETVDLFAFDWNPTTRRFVESWQEPLSANTCFCSIYEECWQADEEGIERIDGLCPNAPIP